MDTTDRRGEYERLGQQMRDLLAMSNNIIDDFHEMKGELKRTKYRIFPECQEAYKAVFPLMFSNFRLTNSPGSALWCSFDSGACAECDGFYIKTDVSNYPRTYYLEHGPVLTNGDRIVLFELCEMFERWVDDTLALVLSSPIRDKTYATKSAVGFKKNIKNLREIL